MQLEIGAPGSIGGTFVYRWTRRKRPHVSSRTRNVQCSMAPSTGNISTNDR